jgi:preprotein translocase subunit YajC
VNGLFIIILLFGALWFLMIRPQQAKARQQQQMLREVEVGDEILTVGGIYGIVQELEPEEDGADLIVEIAEGIHVRVARKALATVVKPDEEDDEEEAETDTDTDTDDEAPVEGGADDAGPDAEPQDGVEEVNDEEETVNPGAAEQPAAPERS